MNTQTDINITSTIGFIGGGNMAQAMLGGLLKIMPAHNIMVSDPVDAVRDIISAQGVQTTTDNNQLVAFADVVILAVKPQLFAQVLTPLHGIFADKLVVSIAAGLPIAHIADLLGHDIIVRAMPNTPALIGQGATGVYAGQNISQQHKDIAHAILASTGLVVWVDTEEKLHAVTAVSGSAPAYFFYVMEAMIEAGTQLGLTQEQAHQLTVQTALGAAGMAVTGEDNPDVLRKKVTSPNGTTHEAIVSMQQNQVGEKIAEAMQACVARSQEMAKNI